MEAAARLPLCPATQDLNGRLVPTLSLLLARELVRLTTSRGHASTWFRQSKLIFSPEAFLQGSQAGQEQGRSGSLKAACTRSLPNGKARLLPAGPRFHGHTQRTPLWSLTSPKRHRLPCVSFPESTSRSRVFGFQRPASTKGRRRCSSGPGAVQKPAVPQEEQN